MVEEVRDARSGGGAGIFYIPAFFQAYTEGYSLRLYLSRLRKDDGVRSSVYLSRFTVVYSVKSR